MKVADYLTAQCWCARTEVEIPVTWVRDGMTDSCDYVGCGPGCEVFSGVADPDPYDNDERPRKKPKMNKWSPARYNPIDDSTPGLPPRAESVSLLVGEDMCACGCGEAPAGKRAKFCMGHDARLKGRLTRAHSAHVTIALVEETTGTSTVLEALEYADRFSTAKVDWRKLITDAADRIAERRGPIDRRAAERAVLDRAAKGGAVRVGRWEKTGSAAAIYAAPDGRYIVEYVNDLGKIETQTVDVA